MIPTRVLLASLTLFALVLVGAPTATATPPSEYVEKVCASEHTGACPIIDCFEGPVCDIYYGTDDEDQGHCRSVDAGDPVCV